MRHLALAAALLAGLIVALAGCGDAPPELRLRPTPGRELVYDAHRVDDWADAELGFGGVLASDARLRLTCLEAVKGRGTYEVVVERLVVSSPERFGVHLDTATAEPDPADRHGTGDVARRLVRRRGELVIGANGGASEPEADRELREILREWGQSGAGTSVAGTSGVGRRPAMMLLDEMLDGPRVAARWMQTCGRLLPSEARPELPATWTIDLAPIPSRAGNLAISMEVTAIRAGERLVTISAKCEPTLEAAAPDAVVDYESGTLKMTLQLDIEQGVVRDYTEQARFVFRKRDAEKTVMPVSWERSLTLVD